MHKKSIISTLTAAATAAASVLSLVPFSAFAVNCLGKSDFDNGKGLPWYITQEFPARQAFDFDDGAFHVEVIVPEGAEKERTDLQLKHDKLNFKAGHEYKVSFRAKANRYGLELTSAIRKHTDEGWDEYFVLDGKEMHMGPHMGGHWAFEPAKLTNEWQTFEGVFTPTEDLENCEWGFQYAKGTMYVGNAVRGDEIWFDDMTIECTTYDALPESERVCGWDSTDEMGIITPRSDVRLNQVGYLPDSVKRATYTTEIDKGSLAFRVVAENGETVFAGKTVPVEKDKEAGTGFFHIIDFSDVNMPGEYTIVVDDEDNVFTNPTTGITYKRYISHKFTIGDEIYKDVLRDAMNYYYQKRATQPIEKEYITSDTSDENKEKLAHKPFTYNDSSALIKEWPFYGNFYLRPEGEPIFNTKGGWYTDHLKNKNVIAGANTLWLMQNMYELSLKNDKSDKWKDKSVVKVPESAYYSSMDTPDVLDEARYELEFMLDMVVHSGADDYWSKDYEDFVYHGVSVSEAYNIFSKNSGDVLSNIRSCLLPPTYAATFNFIACAAQGSRLWEEYDPKFAEYCLEQAKKSWKAVMKYEEKWKDPGFGNGDMQFAPSYGLNYEVYGDNNVLDEAYWAACELYATTGDKEYYDYISKYDNSFKFTSLVPYRQDVVEAPRPSATDDTFASFCETETLDFGTMSLLISDKVNDADKEKIRKNIASAADDLLKAAKYTRIDEKEQMGYCNAMEIPYRVVENAFGLDEYYDYFIGWDTYDFGSNAYITDNALVLAYAYQATGNKEYKDYATYAMDYIFGRNGLDFSYVTGYGSYHANSPYDYYWIGDLDNEFPTAPNGIMVAGANGIAGSPKGIGDEFVRSIGLDIDKTPDQQLYGDSVKSWCCNTVVPEWQAAFAWMLSYMDDNVKIKASVPETTTTTTTTNTTTNSTTTSTTVSTVQQPEKTLWGDANCDGGMDMADVVLVMQALANPDKYGENGSTDNHITLQGKVNADTNGDGLTVGDAQTIQKKLLGIVESDTAIAKK